MHAPRIRQSIALGVLFLGGPAFAAPPADAVRQFVLQAPPAASVNSVAVSPDGSLVASGASEGGARLYDAKTGEMKRVLGEAAGDRSVAFSPDGQTLAGAGFHMDKLVKLCDVQTGKILRTFAGHSQIETCATAFSSDGKLLASACRDHEILVWDVATAVLRYRIDGVPTVALAFSPDGKTLAGGCHDKTVRLWNSATGQLQRSLAGHADCVVTLAFSPDGTTLASGSCDWVNHRGRDTANFAWRDPGCTSQWKLWDAATGELKRTVSEQGRLLTLAFSPDGKSLAAAIGKNVRLYDFRNDGPGRIVASHDFDATCVAFTPDGAALISGSHDQTMKRTELANGKTAWEAPGYWEQVNSLALSADGALLVTGSSDRRFAVRTLKSGDRALNPGAARLWDARTGRLLRRLGDLEEQVMAVAISPDGKRAVTGGASDRGSGVVRLCDLASGSSVWFAKDHAAEVLAIAYSPDGSSLATASADGLVKLRDPMSGSVIRDLANHRGGATSLAFSPDGGTLVCGEGLGGSRVWEVVSGRLLHTCQSAESRAGTFANDRMMTTVTFTPLGATFLSCTASVGNTYGEPVRLWDARTGEFQREIKSGGRPIALSPDGAILAAGGKSIQLTDLRTGDKLQRLTGYLKKIQAIAFSTDGRLVFGGGSYGSTNVWEVSTGRHLITLFAFPNHREGSKEDDWLAYHPDGFYDGSPNAERFVAWRVGDEFQTAGAVAPRYRRADRVEAALKLQVPPSDSP